MVELSIDDEVIEKLMPGASQLDFYEKFDTDGLHVIYDLGYEDVGPDLKRDCFGTIRNFKEMQGMFPTPIEPLIKYDVDPMEFLDSYVPPDPRDPRWMQPLRDAVARLKGKKTIIFAMHTSLIYPAFIRGFENLLLDYYENPEFAKRLAAMTTDFFVELEKQAIDIGADVILEGEDYSGTSGLFMSVEHLKEIVLPGLQRAIDVARNAGIPFVKHCDGFIPPKVVELLIDAGIDALNPIEPVPGMNLGEYKRIYGDRIALWGNVECTNLMTFGTSEEVAVATRKCLEDAMDGGGYILSSSNTIHGAVPPENYLAMVETGRRHGVYTKSLLKRKEKLYDTP
jgi:uroporphyrinogen decarboxylase